MSVTGTIISLAVALVEEIVSQFRDASDSERERHGLVIAAAAARLTEAATLGAADERTDARRMEIELRGHYARCLADAGYSADTPPDVLAGARELAVLGALALFRRLRR